MSRPPSGSFHCKFDIKAINDNVAINHSCLHLSKKNAYTICGTYESVLISQTKITYL